ncbi:hypothetical protein NMY22_g15846 [Coprinellus aureogranulatus]|nr:hypothetical protein NMY22_g15846 [Coprinellus aureogranulatus]
MDSQRLAQSSGFLKLPAEVLHSILNQHEYPRENDLSNFRLVCRLMNDVASHSALRVLRLSGLKATRMREAQLDAFTKNTRVLKLWRTGNGLQEEEVVSQLQGAICDILLGKLKNIRMVQWEVRGWPTKCILDAVGSLPHLECLRLSRIAYPSSGVQEHLAWHLGGLKSITIDTLWIPAERTVDAMNELGQLIKASPQLECFQLRVIGSASANIDKNGLDLWNLVGHALRQSNFQPSLRTLNLPSLSIPPRPSSLNSVERPTLLYLTNLTSLTVSNLEPYHQGLWKMFGAHNIELKEVTVEEPTVPLVNYLQTYRGLQMICLKCVSPERRRARHYVAAEVQHGLMQEAIPHHAESLLDIRFAYPPDQSDFEESWALGEDQIAWFKQFPKLKAVTVSIWKGHIGVKFIPLYDAFQGLFTNLPPTVRLVRVAERIWPATAGPKDLEKFEDLRLTGPIVDYHLKELSYLGFRWYLVRDATDGKYSFEMDEYGFLDSATDNDFATD